MSSKDHILANLRAHRPPFQDAPSPPAAYLPVTHLSDAERSDLPARFKKALEALSGKVHLVTDEEEALEQVLSILDSQGKLDVVLAWEDLPLPGLREALAKRKIKAVSPNIQGSDREEVIAQIEPVRVGITGADAGFATTGTLVLRSSGETGRLSSLLPPIHIALLRRDRLFPRLEDWIAAEGYSALTQSSAVVFATGPSRSSDIERQSVVGVHGPGEVHVVIFSSAP